MIQLEGNVLGFAVFLVLGIKLRTLTMLGKCFTTGEHSQPTK